MLLAERPNDEIVMGIVSGVKGRSRGLRLVDAPSFAAFDEAGCMKAALNFRLQSLDSSSTRVTTETRVFATDEQARRSFARYWLVVGPFSALIRRRMLAVLGRVRSAREEAGMDMLAGMADSGYSPNQARRFP